MTKKRPSPLVAVLLVALVFLAFTLTTSTAQTLYDKDDFSEDQFAAKRLIETVPVTEALGPLAPVAVSPFFGLTCLSGLSIASSQEWVPLPENQLITGNPALNNPLVFAAFLGLTLLTSAPKFTTPTKAVAELADQAETYASVIAYSVIFLAATQAGSNASPEATPVAYSAGFLDIPANALMVIAIAINIIVIHTVKFFFELLVLISPIPTLDAIFEIISKAVTAALAAIYAFSPTLAFIINLFLFLVCLAMFNFCRKRIKYLSALLLDPVMIRLFSIKEPDRGIQRKIPRALPHSAVVCKCFPNKRIGKCRKKDLCYLAKTEGGFALLKPRLIGEPVVQSLGVKNPDLHEGLLHHTIEFTDQMDRPRKLLFSRVYTAKLDQFRALLNIQQEK